MGAREKIFTLLGTLALPIGVILLALGVYGLAGGTALAHFTFSIHIPYVLEAVLSDQEAALAFSVTGILILFCGIAVAHIVIKPSVLIWFLGVLASCSLVVPAVFFGMGNYLTGGILANVFGYPALAMTFIWLTTEAEEITFESMKHTILLTLLLIGIIVCLLVGLDFGLDLF
ncbi:MAG: hypothetical protein OEW62_01515 [Candidatus Bathyarchaeota archaeon]|nr:hypothetical protein [Candidatus Bathyarchaeota archaeon]